MAVYGREVHAMSRIGDNIRKFRKQQKLTQAELAQRTELSVMSIRRYETGFRSPTNEQLEQISKALDIPIPDLLGWDEMLDKAKQIGDRINRSRDGNYPSGDPGRLSMPDKSGFGDCRLSEDEMTIIGAYWQLNNAGKKEALKRILELGKIDTYAQPEE